MIRAFFNLNVKLSNFFETLFSFEKSDTVLLYKFFDRFDVNATVADVGGGKKPAKIALGRDNVIVREYDGYDLDLDELKLAEKHYSEIFKVDLTEPLHDRLGKKYDYIICLNTLEHVRHSSEAIQNISRMLKHGGYLYLKLPCRHALFARLNLVLPQELKKRILHYVFPDKSGDGFEVYYDKSTPKQYKKILEDCGLEVHEVRLTKWSSYFSFFFPLYILWRLSTLLQNALIEDYCESFEIVARHRKVV